MKYASLLSFLGTASIGLFSVANAVNDRASYDFEESFLEEDEGTSCFKV